MKRISIVASVFKMYLLQMIRSRGFFVRGLVFAPIWAISYYYSMKVFSPDSSVITSKILLGLILWIWLYDSVWDVSNCLSSEKKLERIDHIFLTERKTSWVLGMSFALTLFQLLNLAVVWIVISFLFGIVLSANPLVIVLLLILGIITISSLSMFAASLSFRMRSHVNSLSIILDILMLVCGVVYPVVLFSPALRYLSYTLPVTIMIEMAGMDNMSITSGFLIRLAICIIESLVLFGLALKSIDHAERKAMENDSLSRH